MLRLWAAYGVPAPIENCVGNAARESIASLCQRENAHLQVNARLQLQRSCKPASTRQPVDLVPRYCRGDSDPEGERGVRAAGEGGGEVSHSRSIWRRGSTSDASTSDGRGKGRGLSRCRPLLFVGAGCSGAGLALGGEVEGDGGADKVFEGGLVDGFSFVDVDGAADVAVEAGVEEARGVGQ